MYENNPLIQRLESWNCKSAQKWSKITRKKKINLNFCAKIFTNSPTLFSKFFLCIHETSKSISTPSIAEVTLWKVRKNHNVWKCIWIFAPKSSKLHMYILTLIFGAKNQVFSYEGKCSSLRSQCCKMRLFGWFSTTVNTWWYCNLSFESVSAKLLKLPFSVLFYLSRFPNEFPFLPIFGWVVNKAIIRSFLNFVKAVIERH